MSLPGPLLGPKRRHEVSVKIRAALEANPDATLLDLMRLTGASQNVCVGVRKHWAKQRGITISKRRRA